MKRTSLNHVYRILWSQVLDAWVAVAEITRARGKTAKTSHRRLTSVVAALLSLSASLAQGAPAGGQIASGSGSISQAGTTTTVQQGSPKLSVNWASFNVAPQEAVNFVQPSAAAIAVNRIFDTNGSQILGQLNANGQVYLINPNGIVFGHGAQVNVGGLVASTLDLDDASLNGDARSFNGNGGGSVVNLGTINAASGGYVALLGNHVSNQGVISAQLGSVALGAGSAVTLTFSGNSLLRMQVDQSVLNSLAENGGLIRADGGMVLMTAGAKNALLASVVNNTGVIEARTVEDHNGTIILQGGMQAGQVKVGGTLDASAPNGGDGGFIETSAAQVHVVSDARVSTAAPLGSFGTWLIDPQDFRVAATGGDISGATLSANLASTPVSVHSSSGGSTGSGNIDIDDAVSWSADTTLTLIASKHVNVNANIAATGNAAGLAINPNTANGGEAGSGDGAFNLNNGASVTLSGTNPSLAIAGTSYTVINSLGVEGDTSGTTLQGMNGNLAGHYALGSDINANATAAWNGGAGFTPVGTYYNFFTYVPFAGTFDGLGHSIGNLVVNRPGSGGMGMFGVGSATSVIRNVGLVGGSVTGNYGVGFLMGYNEAGSVINNTYATGVVTATGWSGGSDGGLVGFNRGAISNSYATGNVSGTTSVGGLVGSNAGPISNSHATGTVTGSGGVGGLVGGGDGPIVNCYATGSVSSSGGGAGGLVGGASGPISYSYATGNVNGTDSVGGLVGGSATTISNSNATGNVSGSNFVGGLVGYNIGTVSSSHSTSSVSGESLVGGLIGYNAGTISASYAAGSVIGDFDGVGGLAGGNYSGTITNSYATAAVTGSGDFVGGLVGDNSGSISISYATGAVNGSGERIGGLVGNNNYATISDSYAAGQVSGSGNYIGGLVGYDYSGTVTNSYFTGNVSGTGNYIGGLVGGGHGDAIINSHYNVETTTINGSHALTVGGLYSAQYQDWLSHGMTLDIANYASSLPHDSASGYYRLNSVQGLKDLLGFADNAAYKFRLTGNIDLAGTPGLWIPAFAAMEFDGGGHIISNISVNLPFAPFVGMFGLLSSTSTVSNLGIVGGSVRGLTNVGGLAGWSEGTIINSYATGSVEEIGEIITVEPPVFIDSAGGLVGDNFGTISDTYATGKVSGANAVGGLVGYNAGTISTSYSAGSVSGTSNVSGLVGYNSTSAAAGRCGGGCDASQVTSSFWDTQTSGQRTSAGGTGMSTAPMQQQANFTSATSANGNVNPAWDFDNTWVMYETHTYPLLRVFMSPLTVSANLSKTYDGLPAAVGGALSYSTPPNLANLFGTVSYDGTAQGARNVGSYTMTPGGLYSNQQGYIIGYAEGTLTINPATLTCAATPASFTTGQTPSGLSGAVSGFVAGDGLASSTAGTLAWLTPAGSSSPPGHYAINGSGLTAANYVFAQAAGNATALTLNPTTPWPEPTVDPSPANVANLTNSANATTATTATTATPAANTENVPPPPPAASNLLATTQLLTNVLASLESVEPEALEGSPTLTVKRVAKPPTVDQTASPSASNQVDVLTNIHGTGPTLYIVNGGTRLPANPVAGN